VDLNREIKLGELSPPLRIGLIAALALAATAAALLAAKHLRSKTETATPAVPRHVAPRHPAPRVHAKPAKPVSTAPKLPAALTRALRRHRPAVVVLYDPAAPLDGIEVAEAEAGAARAHAAFVPVDVTEPQVNAVATRYSALHDPTVIVVDRSGGVVVELDGFADKETVAQAVATGAR
jgi:hypothetical protein